MRILFDHQVFSLQNAGGASRYFYELMRSFAAAPSDAHTELWLGINDTAYPFAELPGAQAHIVSWQGACCRGLLARGSPRYIANELLGNALAAFAGKLDIYHPTLYRCMPLVRARRIVATHHDCVHERFPELFPDVERILRAKRRLYARADAIICVSESSRRDLLEFYDVDGAKTRVIHHGLNRLVGSDAAAAKFGLQVPEECLLFVGSRAAYKNFDNLLRAFRSTGLHRSLLLVAAGGGPLTPRERALAEQLEISKRLVMLPQLSDAALAEAYATATLMVYPSRYEGFGFPPLEAMAAGCPALVSNTSSLPEVCQDAPFYFDPRERGSLERALLAATSDEAARRRARERGLCVAAGYSWQKCAEETLALYRDCQ